MGALNAGLNRNRRHVWLSLGGLHPITERFPDEAKMQDGRPNSHVGDEGRRTLSGVY